MLLISLFKKALPENPMWVVSTIAVTPMAMLVTVNHVLNFWRFMLRMLLEICLTNMVLPFQPYH